MSTKTVHYPWFKKEDIDAFFALFQNNLANFVIIAVTMIGLGFPASLVFGKVIPGVAVAVIVGNLYYAYMANRLAQKESRSDVTALSYGISTPVMFVFLFGILAPALALTGDPELAWKIGLAAAFLSGFIELLVSFTGNWVRKHLPRPAMLGALAGVAVTFIAGEMLFQVFSIPVVGLVALAIILLGVVGKVTLPFNIPPSLCAVIIGTVLAFVLGYQSANTLQDSLANIGLYPILPSLGAFEGFGYLFGPLVGLLAILLPITIYNAIETMNNVDAMAAAGDSYDVRECQAVDGVGTMIGAVFGGLFPTTVYIATVGSKWMGAGRGYSILNALVFAITAVTGVIAALSELIPLAAVAPILVFVGMSMVVTAFDSNDRKYYPAVALAMLPYVANYVMTRFNNNAGEVVQGISEGIVPLGQGAMFTAIILGAIAVCIIDKQFIKAAVFSLIGAGLSFAGFMHAPELSFNAAPDYSLGYLCIAILFSYCAFRKTSKEAVASPSTLSSKRVAS
ncbi:NCS2 family permease [Halalkalibacterium halodurans]|uniref:NCS2 family permease n=1 Tax=Halalkalibacterium halodurans TaxID=86665 RepID=UPI002E1D9E38|nr:NCS2 family permease [Halalkalibacterium halodurans]MED4084808.1 NCS2 family permease [Halalkalibacterium halodurans]MED4106084.1 NCS2 family permease [Halalkalibacterium halodurans]MED4110723.1 NCS2 family permease [Halalkalibacterium halodurans]MED4150572.1 NCS2 family permease [Halalkalibacterium halodurans]